MKDQLAINGGEKTIDKNFPWPIFDEKEVKAISELVSTGEWGNPDCAGIVEEFEKEFANYCGSKYALSCVNGSVSNRFFNLDGINVIGIRFNIYKYRHCIAVQYRSRSTHPCKRGYYNFISWPYFCNF